MDYKEIAANLRHCASGDGVSCALCSCWPPTKGCADRLRKEAAKAIDMLASEFHGKNTIIGTLTSSLNDVCGSHDTLLAANDALATDVERLMREQEESENTISDLRAQLTIYRGFYSSRLHELIDAELDGRCVVLPCKKGDTVRATVNRPYNGHDATIHGSVTDVQAVIRVEYGIDRYINFVAEDIGKTVFLDKVDEVQEGGHYEA